MKPIIANFSVMPTRSAFAEHRLIQQAAKDVLAELALEISKNDTELSIASKAYQGLCKRGLPDTWYHQCPALVLLGSRSCLSCSGREYEANYEAVGSINLVTVDLSPTRADIWGDCARSFYIEEGRAIKDPQSPEFKAGKEFLERLHAEMCEFVGLNTTFHDLFEWTHHRISRAGFKNLDFLGNAGHSIAKRLEDRLYIEADNHRKLSEVPLFTFEPHVMHIGGKWGFKHENIYFFNESGRIEEL